MKGFDHFGLDRALTRAVSDAGFTEPRPIQVDTIPACLDGRDVMGLAQTGTGKTAAFALPILQRLIEEPGQGPLVLILAPTRELAIQIDAEIRMLAKYTRIATTTVFGGVSANQQIAALRRRPEIVVGCPGRVLDLVQQKRLDLSEVETLVLDEADHMFDMGFLPDIRKILARLPKDRQNLLFSATMPAAIRDLAARVLYEPHVVELSRTAPAERIEHFLCPTDEGAKRDLLTHVLSLPDCQSAIVFTRTKHRAKRLALQLAKSGLRAVGLQGNMSQPQRVKAMDGFRAGRFDILVATDIAARGLDVADVSYVINYDPPSTPETYTHRIGRTGRSESDGKACTFVTHEDGAWIRDTERVLGARIERRSFPGFDGNAVRAPSPDRPRSATSRAVQGSGHEVPPRGPRRRRSGGDASGARPAGQAGTRPAGQPENRSGRQPGGSSWNRPARRNRRRG